MAISVCRQPFVFLSNNIIQRFSVRTTWPPGRSLPRRRKEKRRNKSLERLILRQKSSGRLILKRKKFVTVHYKTTDKYLEREKMVPSGQWIQTFWANTLTKGERKIDKSLNCINNRFEFLKLLIITSHQSPKTNGDFLDKRWMYIILDQQLTKGYELWDRDKHNERGKLLQKEKKYHCCLCCGRKQVSKQRRFRQRERDGEE